MKIKFNFAVEIYKMKLRLFFRTSIIFFLFSFYLFSQQQYEVIKSDNEWKKQLDKMSYLVLRKAYTESHILENMIIFMNKVHIIVLDVMKLYINLTGSIIPIADGQALIWKLKVN